MRMFRQAPKRQAHRPAIVAEEREGRHRARRHTKRPAMPSRALRPPIPRKEQQTRPRQSVKGAGQQRRRLPGTRGPSTPRMGPPWKSSARPQFGLEPKWANVPRGLPHVGRHHQGVSKARGRGVTGPRYRLIEVGENNHCFACCRARPRPKMLEARAWTDSDARTSTQKHNSCLAVCRLEATGETPGHTDTDAENITWPKD